MSEIQIGKGEKLVEGVDIAVLSVGPIAFEVAKAIERTQQNGVSVAHYDMIFVKPLDEEILREVADKNCPIITVEDAAIAGGFGSAVIEWMNINGYSRVVRRIGVPDEFVAQGTPTELYHQCRMDADAIYETIVSLKNEVR